MCEHDKLCESALDRKISRILLILSVLLMLAGWTLDPHNLDILSPGGALSVFLFGLLLFAVWLFSGVDMRD